MGIRGSKKGERRGGRQKGTPNKLTRNIRESIERAFDAVGGETYLAEVAREDRRTFCTLLAKCVPTQLTGGEGPPIRSEMRTMSEQDARAMAAVEELCRRTREIANLGADEVWSANGGSSTAVQSDGNGQTADSELA
jgi:hypothetical protein